MNKKNKSLLGLVLAIGLVISSESAFASGLSNQETCISNAYGCQSWGYTGVDRYGYYGSSSSGANGTLHNCTSYAAYMLDFVTPYDNRWSGLGMAVDWATNAKKLGLAVGTIPHEGDVAHWNFGHVAYVEAVNVGANGLVASIEVTDDNWERNQSTRKMIYVGGDNSVIHWPDHFITFPRITGGGGFIKPRPTVVTVPTD